MADHVQGVMKTNFLASWDEIGDSCEMEDTYVLSSMKDLDGMFNCFSLNAKYFIFKLLVS